MIVRTGLVALFVLVNSFVFSQHIRYSYANDTINGPYSQPHNIQPDKKGGVYALVEEEIVGGGTYSVLFHLDSNGVKTFDEELGDDTTWYYNLTQDFSGNIYLAGATHFPSPFVNGIRITKYTSDGNRLWTTIWNPYNSAIVTPAQIKTAPNGTVYVCGLTTTMPNSNNDIFLLAVNDTGSVNWEYTYNAPVTMSLDVVSDIEFDDSSNIYMSGYTGNINASWFTDFTLIKVNSAGQQQWIRKLDYTMNGGTSSRARSLDVDKNGDIYVCGMREYYTPEGKPTSGMMLGKFDRSGQQYWMNYVAVDSQSFWSDVEADNSGGCYVCGEGMRDTSFFEDIGGGQFIEVFEIIGNNVYLSRYGDTGQVLWNKKYNNRGNDGRYTYSLKNTDTTLAFFFLDEKDNIILLDTNGNEKFVYESPVTNQYLANRVEWMQTDGECFYSTFISGNWSAGTPFSHIIKVCPNDTITEDTTIIDNVKDIIGGAEFLYYNNGKIILKNIHSGGGSVEIASITGQIMGSYQLQDDASGSMEFVLNNTLSVGYYTAVRKNKNGKVELRTPFIY